MTTSLNHNERIANAIETSIFNRIKEKTRVVYLEVFICFLTLGFILLFVGITAFKKNIFAGIFVIILLSIILTLAYFTWKSIKTISKENPYKIIEGKGKWEFNLEGHGKSAHLVSRVNGKKISMILAEFYDTPSVNKPKEITYEYTNIFDPPPLFGHGSVFVSINNHKLTEKHRDLFSKIKSITLFSIIGTVIFPITLIFNIGINFEALGFTIVNVLSFFVFYRTIKNWRSNKKLLKIFKHNNVL